MRFRFAIIVFIVLPFTVTAAEPAKKRPITLEDLWKVKRLGKPAALRFRAGVTFGQRPASEGAIHVRSDYEERGSPAQADRPDRIRVIFRCLS